MKQEPHHYPLSVGPEPLRVKHVLRMIGVMSASLLSLNRQDPFSDVVIPQLLLLSASDRKLLTELYETRQRIELAAKELAGAKVRPTFTCPREMTVNKLLVATLLTVANEVISAAREGVPPVDLGQSIKVYRVCAENLIDRHLAAIHAKPTPAVMTL